MSIGARTHRLRSALDRKHIASINPSVGLEGKQELRIYSKNRNGALVLAAVVLIDLESYRITKIGMERPVIVSDESEVLKELELMRPTL